MGKLSSTPVIIFTAVEASVLILNTANYGRVNKTKLGLINDITTKRLRESDIIY